MLNVKSIKCKQQLNNIPTQQGNNTPTPASMIVTGGGGGGVNPAQR
jgi:hypothetical protein